MVCGHLNVLNAQLVELAAEALESGSWEGWGVRSLEHWLTWQAGISPGHAREVVRLARARDSHPAVMSTFAAGAISMDQAATATKAPAYLDEQFAESARVATVVQLRTMVRAARPAPKPAPARDEPNESLTGWFDDDGRYHLRGELDADHGRVVDAALREARDALFAAGQTNVTWAEALVEMAQRSLDGVAGDERRDRFRVNWFVDPTDPVPARWPDGLAVPNWLRDMLTCDATVAPVFTDGALPVSVGRTQRAVPERTRRLVLARDRNTCRVPWCAHTRWLQVHHIEHWEDGGSTDTAKLAALCPADHRLHHRGLLGISGNADDPDGLVFTDRHGRIIDAAAHPTPPTGPPPAPAAPYEHPLGERLQRWAIMYPDPPEPDPPGRAA